jgi:hypothetical protein
MNQPVQLVALGIIAGTSSGVIGIKMTFFK